jgi:hypothetical protein
MPLCDEVIGVGTSSAGKTGRTGNLNDGGRDGGIGSPDLADSGKLQSTNKEEAIICSKAVNNRAACRAFESRRAALEPNLNLEAAGALSAAFAL